MRNVGCNSNQNIENWSVIYFFYIYKKSERTAIWNIEKLHNISFYCVTFDGECKTRKIYSIVDICGTTHEWDSLVWKISVICLITNTQNFNREVSSGLDICIGHNWQF